LSHFKPRPIPVPKLEIGASKEDMENEFVDEKIEL
jgi:hypothetical protein